ncbi:hypothetical protein B0H10DRAFT_2089137, partial [Mycena sp. CBHHK59/15]
MLEATRCLLGWVAFGAARLASWGGTPGTRSCRRRTVRAFPGTRRPSSGAREPPTQAPPVLPQSLFSESGDCVGLVVFHAQRVASGVEIDFQSIFGDTGL